MATEEEKRKAGVVPMSSINVPGPQRKANAALGAVGAGTANMAKQATQGAKSIPGKTKSGFDSMFDKASNFLQGKLDASKEKIALGDKLTKAVPLLGSKTPGKDITKGTLEAVKGAGKNIQWAADNLAGGKGTRGAIDWAKGAKAKVTSDYNRNEVRTGRATPESVANKKTASGVAQAATTGAITGGAGAGSNTRIRADKQKKGTGKILATNTQGNPAGEIVGDVSGYKRRQAENRKKKKKTAQGGGAIHQVGNMDVAFDPNVSPEARKAFLNINAGGDQVTRMRSGMGSNFTPGPRVTGPNPYGANQQPTGPEFVTRETHPNLTGEAATAINAARQRGWENRQSLGVTGENRMNQIGAEGINSLNNYKQMGMNSLGQQELRGIQGMAQEQQGGRDAMALEQFKQANEDKFDYIPPKHDKKGNQLPGTGLYVPKDPYTLSEGVSDGNYTMEDFAKLDYLRGADETMYEQVMQKYGLTQ